MTDNADTALYGRVTYQLMESYWPKQVKNQTHLNMLRAPKWYDKVTKVVLSETINDTELTNTKSYQSKIFQKELMN